MTTHLTLENSTFELTIDCLVTRTKISNCFYTKISFISCVIIRTYNFEIVFLLKIFNHPLSTKQLISQLQKNGDIGHDPTIKCVIKLTYISIPNTRPNFQRNPDWFICFSPFAVPAKVSCFCQ